jgi:hypothetical protein
VIKTTTDLFGLAGPLNKRDASAASFALLLASPNPRASNAMPAKLNRPSLNQTVTSEVAGVNVKPEDEPLDDLTEEWVKSFAELSARRAGLTVTQTTSAAGMPTTQGQASEFIDARLKRLGL